MNNYKQTAVSGDSYERAFRIIVENKKGDTPHMTFQNEMLLNVNGTEQHLDADSFTSYFDPAATFPLINPMDDSPLGQTGSDIQFQVLLYSKYVDARNKRDAAKAEAAAKEAAYAAQVILDAQAAAATP
jgi:hypothetical protein